MKCANVCIGDMRHRLVLQEAALSQTDAGGQLETWVTVATLWGSVTPLSSAERYFSERLEMLVSHKILIRYRKGIRAKQRLLFKDRVFQIKGVKNLDELDRFMELSCMEGTAS